MIPEFIKIKDTTGCKMIVGIENANPILMFFGKFFFGEYNNQQLNAGTYIGFVSDVLEIIEKVYKLNPNNDADDQVLMTDYCQQNDKEIYIDSKNQLFLTLCHPLYEIDKHVEINEETHMLTYNSNQPFFIHANFYGYLDGVISKLGYDIKDDEIKNELFANFLEKKIWHYIKEVFFQYFLIIFFILFIILFLILFIYNFTYFIPTKKKLYKKNKFI
jgi:hypothetical protein